MTVLVLGSSGQIGAYLVKHLRNLGEDVLEYDIVKSEHQDLRIRNYTLSYYLEMADFVFFLAFDVGGSRYLSKYQHTYEFMRNNIKIMDTTFDELKSSQKPFVFASSQMSNMSYSPYGVAKAVGENYTKALNGITVKFWNVYGVENDPEKSHVITDFIIKASTTGTIDMMTDGQEERDFLYASDCCEALVSIMKNYDSVPRDQELCVTSFKYTKIIDLANFIADYFDAEVIPSDKSDLIQLNKKNSPSKYILNYWSPKTSIEEGIMKVIYEMGLS